MAHLDRSGVDQIDRTKKIHLADIDAVVAEDGVGHRDMEKDVGDRHLQQVVLAADDLARRPGEFDLSLARARVLRLLHALRESDGLPDAGAQFVDRLFVVLVLGRRVPREPGSTGFDIVASALDLVDEILHVRREATGQKHVEVELFRGRMLLSFVEAGFEVLQDLRALRDHLIVHNRASISSLIRRSTLSLSRLLRRTYLKHYWREASDPRLSFLRTFRF